MKVLFRLFGLWLLLAFAQAAWSQESGLKIDRVVIQYVGPASVNEQFIRSNIRAKAGDTYTPNLTQEDIHSLYATEQFYNIRASIEGQDDGGVILTYIVQARLRITDVKISGNKDLSASKIRKKITVKAGEPLDEEKLFTDTQEIKKLYEKYGYPGTTVKYVFDSMDEAAGTASVTFQVSEAQKIRITEVDFDGATAFTQKVLRKQVKTRAHWTFSWLTGSGVFKQDQFDDDKDALVEFYHSHGYLDFQITDVKFDHPDSRVMVVHFVVFEGKQYRVGSVRLTGNKIFTDAQIRDGLIQIHEYQHIKGNLGTNGLPMDVGNVFTPQGLSSNLTLLEDFYGSKGYIDYLDDQLNPPMFQITRVPNVDKGTMDIEFNIQASQKTYVERIDIRGNVKTKDKVIRRELAISPGEVFDMVRVKISQQRLEGLQYFDKVDMDPEPTDPPIAGRKNLEVNVEEQETGKFTLGAGFSSVNALVGFAEIDQQNFDLFHPPYFTGGGERFRLFVQLGTEEQDYEAEFVHPWLFNRQFTLDVDIYRHQWDFDSPNNIYDETRTGFRVGITRALSRPVWMDDVFGPGDLTAGIGYTLEDVGISLNSGWNDLENVPGGGGFSLNPKQIQGNVPSAILSQVGDHVFNRFDTSLAYDTRNDAKLPNHGQRTEFDPSLSMDDSTTFYKVEAKTAWFFPGFFKGHILEADGRIGVAKSINGGDVPFYDRYYLGGLYSLRGFKYRNIGPRDPTFSPTPSSNPAINPAMPNEPIGGDSYWYGSLNYSIPIIDTGSGPSIRFELFYDVGDVGQGSYSFSGNFDDNWGAGLLLDIPHLGPLRLEYGVPISHDQFNSGSGQFQFGVGYQREF
ncbi:MAG TPA: outer membrane protein assembly factor BamA [Verrucomicrobiae bacterium]|jgi:outer membrane protein insertion porin family